MGLRVFWRFPSDSGDMTANSTASGFPVRNLQRATLSSKHKTDGSNPTELWTCDMGSAVEVSAFFAGGHDFQSGDTITLRYANDSGFTSGVGTVSPTFDAGPLLEFFSPVTRRYWRLENLKDVPAETRSLGRFLLGPSFEFTRSLLLSYASGIRFSTTKRLRTEGGQYYSDLGEAIRGQRGTLIVNDLEKDEIETLRGAYQTAFPFVSAIDWDSYPFKKSVYGVFESIREPTNIGVEHWSYQWDITEQK